MTISRLTCGLAALAVLTLTALPATATPEDAATASRPVAAAASHASLRNLGFLAKPTGESSTVQRRPSPVFRPGEGIAFYAETVNLGWSRSGPKAWRFDVVVDIEVRRPDGAVVWGQKNFGRLSGTGSAPDASTAISGTVSLKNAPPGIYLLGLRLRDEANGRIVEAEIPFAIFVPPRRIDA